jgi:hypothetical protein
MVRTDEFVILQYCFTGGLVPKNSRPTIPSQWGSKQTTFMFRHINGDAPSIGLHSRSDQTSLQPQAKFSFASPVPTHFFWVLTRIINNNNVNIYRQFC